MNIVRFNAGGCSSNPVGGTYMQMSPNIPAVRQIQGYWLDPDCSDPSSSSWNWSVNANQLAMLRKAKNRGANLLELFSNSPMWWMCYNHNPSGADNGANDNLKSLHLDSHAVYLATIAKYAQTNWGVKFDSVEPFNEPGAKWWTSTGTQEGCHFASPTQATVISDLRSELDHRGLTSLRVAASDENTYDSALSTWHCFNSTTQSQIGRVNVHGYQNEGGKRSALYSAVVGKRLWLSEYGDGDASGLKLASHLNLDFQLLHPSGWCYWQALDEGGWGLIQSILAGGWIGPVNSKYFVLAQYTRHIRPGMTIIGGGAKNTLAAYDPKGRKLVVVTANYGAARWITYNLSNFPLANGPIHRWMTATGTGPRYQFSTNLVISGRMFKAWFPINTIQTFEIQNVDLNSTAARSAQSFAATAGKLVDLFSTKQY